MSSPSSRKCLVIERPGRLGGDALTIAVVIEDFPATPDENRQGDDLPGEAIDHAGLDDDFPEADEHLYPDETDLDETGAPGWRRPLLIAVAVVTLVALAMVPVYNLIDRGQPRVADNGLEVCGFDYCLIQDVVTDAGLDLSMSRLSTTFLSDDEAAAFTAALLDHVGEAGVDFEMVDRLDGDIEGQFSPAANLIQVERPARAWIVLHEVAHVGTDDHGESFQRRLIELTEWVDSGGGS